MVRTEPPRGPKGLVTKIGADFIRCEGLHDPQRGIPGMPGQLVSPHARQISSRRACIGWSACLLTTIAVSRLMQGRPVEALQGATYQPGQAQGGRSPGSDGGGAAAPARNLCRTYAIRRDLRAGPVELRTTRFVLIEYCCPTA